jgi:hypothetical protein
LKVFTCPANDLVASAVRLITAPAGRVISYYTSLHFMLQGNYGAGQAGVTVADTRSWNVPKDIGRKSPRVGNNAIKFTLPTAGNMQSRR